MRVTIKPFELRGFNLSPDIFHVYLRVYALNYFVRQSDGVIVQPGGPAESPFYEEWPCTRNNGSLLLPEIALESTIDALSPAHPESLRYYAGFFDPGGSMLCAFWPRPIFALDTNPNPTTWAHVVAYNSPGVEFDWTTTHAEHYSKEEFDKLLQNPPQGLSGITVLPPLYFDGTTLWIPRASSTQDGYLAAEDFIAFSIGAGMGVISFNTRQGVIVLLSQDVLDALTYAPVNKAGDTLTGPLILMGHPSTGNPFEAATRGYVDSILGGGDVTPPAITNVHTSTPTSTGVTIMWNTDGEASDSQVEYGNPGGASGSYPNSTTPINPSPGVTLHSVPLSSLTPGATYHYRVKSRDFASPQNMGVSSDQTFTTAAGADATAPTLSAENATVTGTSVTITWTTNELADSEVNYGLTTGYGTPTGITQTGGQTTGHSVTISSLAAGTYHYQCKSRDLSPAQNLGVSSADHTFTIAAVDATAPVISAVAASSLSTTGATITWTTDDFSDSQVQYSVDPDTSYSTHTITTDTGAGVQNHTVVLSGVLAPGTTYHYRVKSTNAAALSNTGVATPDTFATTPSGPVNHLRTGLTAMWQMEETTSTATRVDSFGIHNATALSNIYSGTGKVGTAAHWPASDGNRLAVTSTADLQTGPVDYTWAMWVKLDDLTSDHEFVCKAGGAGGIEDEYIIGFQKATTTPTVAPARFRLTVQGGSYASVYSSVAPVANQWYFLVCWHKQSTAEIFLQVDGGTPDSFTPTPPLVSGGTDIYFGCYGNGTTNYLAGWIDEAAFWKGLIVSDADKAAMYASGSGLPFTSWAT